MNSYKAVGVPYPSGTHTMIWNEYQYFNDGQIFYAKDNTSSNFDRAYLYDHTARVSDSRTGPEARDLVNQTSGGRPYKKAFGWDVWNKSISKTGRIWSASITETQSYNYARKQSWT